ncbi:hypothetical protein METBIDRAFT_197023 [Metschnikowia bicuspidata var. bicuspidata NRRL YB-4993]|uniref:Uncharacterized protein n=1 Tax=Metschnikowia bicuspidata var. bicuspidata NRRL YB-4993 TaxID=869754 RepID=A0A1A0H8Z7_9ASCO|nr:hypothetical protein METBIDRAFT_197023 [Metschnikowia bicuspidata var. bicuspidata NRRL YB-4993]OBA20357.1 hypothetical protein METBIDRAFT_197023 [Metschnikowia bicuspidata var. bicuspidata NRRL YB-4993]
MGFWRAPVGLYSWGVGDFLYLWWACIFRDLYLWWGSLWWGSLWWVCMYGGFVCMVGLYVWWVCMYGGFVFLVVLYS